MLVIELVENEVDKHKDITLGSYGCGWTFLQVIYKTVLFCSLSLSLYVVPFNVPELIIIACILATLYPQMFGPLDPEAQTQRDVYHG